jgi:hypothetical protein
MAQKPPRRKGKHSTQGLLFLKKKQQKDFYYFRPRA